MEELLNKVAQDPADPAFAELAEQLRKQGNHSEAQAVCLQGLSKNPAVHAGRLVLARSYFDKGFIPFAARELEILCRDLPQSRTLRKLLETVAPARAKMLGPIGEVPQGVGESTVAETDFSLDDIELLDSEDKA